MFPIVTLPTCRVPEAAALHFVPSDYTGKQRSEGKVLLLAVAWTIYCSFPLQDASKRVSMGKERHKSSVTLNFTSFRECTVRLGREQLRGVDRQVVLLTRLSVLQMRIEQRCRADHSITLLR